MARLSDAQRRLLGNVNCGRSPHHGIFEHNAFNGSLSTLSSCMVHGLVRHTGDYGSTWYLTEKGARALRDGSFKKQRKDK